MAPTATIWLTIGLLAVGTIAIKGAGPLALGGDRTLPPRASSVIGLLAPPILAALVLVETIGNGSGGLKLDARIVGLAAAAVALALRLPVLVVVIVAAAAAAAVRAVT